MLAGLGLPWLFGSFLSLGRGLAQKRQEERALDLAYL